jgi:Resolvase, N terminal domain
MVEVFDAHGVSFVAVTQQFNTTTSMGRLTLNVLLSFAQFEREVTGDGSATRSLPPSVKACRWVASFRSVTTSANVASWSMKSSQLPCASQFATSESSETAIFIDLYSFTRLFPSRPSIETPASASATAWRGFNGLVTLHFSNLRVDVAYVFITGL